MARKPKTARDVDSTRDTNERIRTGVERNTPTQSPLGQEHLNALNRVIDECRRTKEMCESCIAAGIDVEPEMKVNAEQMSMAERLKATFFPHSS